MAGKLERSLISRGMLGTEETIVWDGRKNDGNHAEIGVYLFFGEIIHPSGKTKIFKKVITLIRKYNH
jgi:hypothetical protein